MLANEVSAAGSRYVAGVVCLECVLDRDCMQYSSWPCRRNYCTNSLHSHSRSHSQPPPRTQRQPIERNIQTSRDASQGRKSALVLKSHTAPYLKEARQVIPIAKSSTSSSAAAACSYRAYHSGTVTNRLSMVCTLNQFGITIGGTLCFNCCTY